MLSRDEIVEKNLGLVHMCVKRFQGKGIEYEDLYSAGCVGLIKAIDSFDETRGFKLSTYAVPVILGEIKRMFRDGGCIKVSRSLKELSLKVMKLNNDILQESGQTPSVTFLAEKLNVSPEQIVECLNISSTPISLTQPEDESENRFHQIDIKSNDTEEELVDTIALKSALTSLDSLDRALIILRYFNGKTQTQTAKILGMTQVQVSRKEKKILQKMKIKLDDKL